jgi:hypothetical protein
MTYRGSRKHVLDWTQSPTFPAELQELVGLADCTLTAKSVWVPRGYSAPKEARLERATFLDATLRKQIRSWWLKHHKGANTPNWDIVTTCEVAGRAGLILVEAKANVPELGLIRFRGHVSKGGYDVPHAQSEAGAPSAPAVH